MQYQGEQFSIALRTGSVRNGGTLIAQQNVFKLYDDDSPITAFNNPINVSSGATSHTQQITFGNFSSNTGTFSVPFRIYRADIQQDVFEGTAFDNGGTATCIVNNVPAAGSSAVYTIYVNNGITEYNFGTYTVTRSAPSLVAPVISSVTDNNAAASSVTATVNLSSSGSGGTLQYIQTTTNSAPAYNASGWQSGNTFSHPRGTTRYYWAQQVSGTNRAISSSVAKYEGYIAPDTSISPIANQSFTSAILTHTITIAGGGEFDYYQVRNASTGEVHEECFGNENITVTDALSSGSRTYRIYTRRDPFYGGDNGYDDTGTTYTVTVTPATSETFFVDVFVDQELESVYVSSGTNKVVLGPSDILEIRHTNASNASSVTVSPFNSNFWTNTANLTISEGSSGSRQVKAPPSSYTENGTLTVAGGGFTGTIFFAIREAPPPPPPVDPAKPDSFSINSVTNVSPNEIVQFNTISVTGNTTTATSRVSGGAQQRKSPTGTWTTSDLSVVAGDTIYLRATASSSFSTTTNYTLRIGNLSGTLEDYDYETASFSITTGSDPSFGQTILFPITSGTISLGDIISFFHFPGNPSPIGPQPAENLGSYYRGGTYVPNVTGNSAIPTSGLIKLSDFYGSETRWYVTPPPAFFRDQNTLSGPSSFTLQFTLYNDLFGGGYAPDVGKRSQFKNGSPVIIWENNAGPLTLSGGSSTYTSNFSLTVSTTASANQEREIYGYIPIDARSVHDTAKVQTGIRAYFWFFFYGP